MTNRPIEEVARRMQNHPHRLFAWIAAALAALLLAGCSFGEKRPVYYDEEETADLEIPEGLARPDHSGALIINTPPIPPPSMVMETRPPRVSNTTSGLDANSSFNWSSQGLYLSVDDTPESVHRRLGLVIERAGMQRVSLDDLGVYRFDYYQTFNEEDGFFKKLAFWSRDRAEDYSGAYQVFTRPDGDQTRVYIKYADGTDCEPDAAEHLLAVLRARLG
ncbi:MAG: hypothetical protein HKP16_01120 [Xanthomonadales bacterium]|nr:hypothetical protein [Xanthomonadales bacterium]